MSVDTAWFLANAQFMFYVKACHKEAQEFCAFCCKVPGATGQGLSKRAIIVTATLLCISHLSPEMQQCSRPPPNYHTKHRSCFPDHAGTPGSAPLAFSLLTKLVELVAGVTADVALPAAAPRGPHKPAPHAQPLAVHLAQRAPAAARGGDAVGTLLLHVALHRARVRLTPRVDVAAFAQRAAQRQVGWRQALQRKRSCLVALV